MQDLLQKIATLQNQSAVLEPDKNERQNLLARTSEYLVEYVDRLETDPAYSGKPVDRPALQLTEQTKTLDEIIETYDLEVGEKGIRASSGKHLGYIPGGGIFASTLGDMMVATTNAYTGINYGSPGGAAIEETVLDWIKSVFGFPKSAVGNLTSGGSIANLTALTAARDKHKIKGGRIENSVIYMSEQVHHCVNKALRIIGLEDVIIRHITLDERHRMVTGDLTKKIAADKANGLNPFLVVGSAGTTDTGAIDPLKSIAEIAQRNQLWFHIDAAYGGFFILAESRKQYFDGIEMADSVVVDPHKCFFLPYGIGAVVIKDRAAVWESFHYTANYMRDSISDHNEMNAADVSPELTKHFRAMRMWLPMQLYGIKPFAACLEEKIHLTEYMRLQLLNKGFEVGPEPDLTVSYFWVPMESEKQNDFNKKFLEHIHKDGRIYFSSTILNGQFVIRIAVCSFRTKLRHIDEAINMLEEIKDRLLI